MHKTAKIDFFTVEIADSIDLETILRMVHQKPSDSQKRNVEINDDWIRLARGNLTDDGYLGDMMRISMAPAGFRANLAGDITAVSLSKDEGMAECSAFYYDFETSILALQRNSKAVSSRMLSSYFKQIGDVEGGKEGIFEVHVMKDKDHLSDAQVSVWIGDKDGKELEERSAGEWRADEDCFDCHVRVPKDMPEGTKLFVLIRKGDLEIKDSFELGHDE